MATSMMHLSGLFVLLFTVAIQGNDQVEVAIKNGKIIGQRIVEQGIQLDQFLGIPYAQPPVGRLRFRQPVPVEPWNEPVQALEWSNNCIQTYPPQLSPYYLNQNFSEDCLYLNIWSPNTQVDEEHLRPVLVYIHGGGLLSGSSSMILYGGRTLAAMADIVVVSFNYRLSTLGFLYSDEVQDVKGNQGFWDQALVLEWVNENIRYFGGDPSRITLGGVSAGAWSVSAHILSPVTRHLFHKAILMSGAVNFGVVDRAEAIVAKQLKGIRAVGCAEEGDTSISSKVVQCLQQLEPEKVDQIYYESGPMFHKIAVAEGQFFPKMPGEMISSGDHKQNFDLLIDTTEDEGTPIFIMINKNPLFGATSSVSLEEAQEIIYKEAVDSFPKSTVSKEAISKIYFNGMNPNFDNENLVRKKVGVAYGDFILNCPTIEFARSLFRNSPETVKVYQWYYTAKLGKSPPHCPEWTGACHGDDISPVFGLPFQQPPMFVNRMRDISREVIFFFKSFISTGTPGDEHSEWQSYFMSVDGQSVVAPYYELGNQPKSHQSFKFNLKRTECDLWNQYYE